MSLKWYLLSVGMFSKNESSGAAFCLRNLRLLIIWFENINFNFGNEQSRIVKMRKGARFLTVLTTVSAIRNDTQIHKTRFWIDQSKL